MCYECFEVLNTSYLTTHLFCGSVCLSTYCVGFHVLKRISGHIVCCILSYSVCEREREKDRDECIMYFREREREREREKEKCLFVCA